MLISGKLFYCLRLMTWCLSQVLDTCCLLKEIWLDLRFQHFGNYQTKIKLNSSMPIPPLQIKWHLAILTWTINKSIQQSNQNNLSEAPNEYNNRDTGAGQSSAYAVLCKDKQTGLQSRGTHKAPSLHSMGLKGPPAPLTTLQSWSKSQIPQTQLTTEREEGKALSSILAVAGCGLHQCPTQLSPQQAPRTKVANPNLWCLSDAERTPSCP